MKNATGRSVVVVVTKRQTISQLGSKEISNPRENLSDQNAEALCTMAAPWSQSNPISYQSFSTFTTISSPVVMTHLTNLDNNVSFNVGRCRIPNLPFFVFLSSTSRAEGTGAGATSQGWQQQKPVEAVRRVWQKAWHCAHRLCQCCFQRSAIRNAS